MLHDSMLIRQRATVLLIYLHGLRCSGSKSLNKHQSQRADVGCCGAIGLLRSGLRCAFGVPDNAIR
eukprot:3406636-Pleurochrysis_carterae.AAC.2